MHRLFIAKDKFPMITGSDVHYLRDVLRKKAGDPIELLDGSGKIYSAKISKIGKERIECDILSSHRNESEPAVKVTLAQSLPKGNKMDFIVEKCTELGVHRMIPMLSERSVAKEAKLDRWQKLAKEAAEQSGRAVVPEISELIQFDEVLKARNNFDLALIPWELEKETTLKKVLTAYLPAEDLSKAGQPNYLSTILILIGPEGGFSQAEVDKARKAGFTSVSLGKRILRAETAGMAVLSCLTYEWEER